MGETVYGQLSVLVVDHDDSSRARAASILTRLGVVGPVLTSGVEAALEEIDAHDAEFDLIMTELNLPGGDGVNILRQLAKRNCGSAVVLVTGVEPRMRDAGLDLARARGLRVLGGLTKPMTLGATDEIFSQLSFSRPAPTPASGLKFSPEDLNGAVDGDQLLLYFQPKIAIDGKSVLGVEALVRWMHPEYGLLPPDTFIHQLAENNLIDRLTYVVLDKALVQLRAWNDVGLDLNLSVNIAAESLNDMLLPPLVHELLSCHNIDPTRLTLELTETGLLTDHANALDILTQLRLAGIGVSIDDFGTGYATISRLAKLPFDELKIDRSLVTGAPQSERTRTILGSTLQLAQDLNLKTVAEGVETVHELTLLQELGCEAVQGFYLAMPMPGENLPGWASHRMAQEHGQGGAGHTPA